MLLQRLGRLGYRGHPPLALFATSFGTGAEPQLSATTAACGATASSATTAIMRDATIGSAADRPCTASEMAAGNLRSEGSAVCSHGRGYAATAAAAAASRLTSTARRSAITSAAWLHSYHGLAATAATAADRRSGDAYCSGTARGFGGSGSVRGYAATAAPARDPRFAALEDSDLDAFRGMLGPNGVLTDAAALQAVNKCAAIGAVAAAYHCGLVASRTRVRCRRVLPIAYTCCLCCKARALPELHSC